MKNVNTLGLLGIILTGCQATTTSSTFSSSAPALTITPTVAAATADIAFTNYLYIAANGTITEFGLDPDTHLPVNLDTQSYGEQGKAVINSGIDNAAYDNMIIHPNGKWLYTTMNYWNATGTFSINSNGTLSKIGTGIGNSCMGPESIAFNSAGNLMYVECLSGGVSSIISMTINPATGALGATNLASNQAGMAAFISANSLTFPAIPTSASLGTWSYAFTTGYPVAVYNNGDLFTLSYIAEIGTSMVIH